MKHLVVFDDFFALGSEETSPFLTPSSRVWAKQLPLRSAFIAAACLVISFALSFHPKLLPVAYLLLALVYFFAGVPSLIDSIEDIASLTINIDVLMTIAAFSSVLIGSGFEGGLLLVLFALSHSIEEAVTSKAKGAISGLKKLSPTRACVLQPDGTLIDRNVADINVGTQILVKASEIVPLDGTVIAGASSVNLVHLTGENLPVPKEIGDLVAAGARNLEGALTLEVTHTSADSTLSKIIQLVTEAQESRPRLQRWFDKLSERYAVTIILLSTLFALAFPWFLAMPYLGVHGSVYRALAFLIAASPCALILAIPIAYLSAISVCARRGILLKGGVTLDALDSCKAIAFDKTGTLTTGVLSCLSVEQIAGPPQIGVELAVAAAAAMEQNAVHPIATAIINYAAAQRITPSALTEFLSVPGYGLQALVETTNGPQQAYIGRYAFMEPRLTPTLAAKLQERIQEAKQRGELIAILSIGEALFLFRFADTIRPGIKETIQRLKGLGRWRLLMLTGDHSVSARLIATELGIDEFYAELLPEDKLNYVTSLANKEGLTMVGDGVNDAPALARATVGICMGKVGSAAAIDAADVVLLHDDLDLLDWLMAKAHQTQVIVRQNLGVATAAIIIASSAALFGLIPLWLAVVMHEGGTVLVGLNALRLLKQN